MPMPPAYSMTPSPQTLGLMSLDFQFAAWDSPQYILPRMGQDSGLVRSFSEHSYAYLVAVAFTVCCQ